MREIVIEGFWDCPYCDTKEVSGFYRECPNCGSARGAHTKFYTTENSRELSEEEIERIGDLPDWLCSYCDNLNSSKARYCASCGASKADSNKNYFDLHNVQDKQHTEEYATLQQDTIQYTKSHSIPLLLGTLSIGVLVLLISIFIPKQATLVIDNMSWERTITIEEKREIQDSGWTLPPNARNVKSNMELYGYSKIQVGSETKTRQVAKQRISGYETVKTGTKDKGNGTFEVTTKQKPIYETYYETETYQEPIYKQRPDYRIKYYYTIDSWVKSREVKTSGKDKNPKWGDLNLSKKEREGSYYEKYYILATDKDGIQDTYELTFNDWKSVSKGDTLHVKKYIGDRLEILKIITSINTAEIVYSKPIRRLSPQYF